MNAVSVLMSAICSTVANIQMRENACLNEAAEKEISSHYTYDV